MFVFTTTVFVALCFIFTRGQNDPEELEVEISSGRVKGRRAYTADLQQVYYAFQGIPYAEPPIGDLRFRAPVPVKKWEGVLTAQKDEHKCIQEFQNPEGSEDCLYINVFTPKTNTTFLPVMVWIYGGIFIEGHSKEREFPPDYFLEEEVVVVTFNYRLGVFGFMSTEDSASPGNYALKDQILALSWVQQNINYFGGNRQDVTLFGQSAGSAAVSYLMQTPLTKNLFRKAIMQSGTTLNLWALSRNPKKTAFAIGKSLNIETDNTTVLVEALRKIEARTLQVTSISTDLTQTLLSNPRDGLIFAPTMEPRLPGAVITKKSHERLNLGDFNRVPCIVGFTSEEGLPFKKIMDHVRPYFLSYDIFSTRLVPIDMNIESSWKKIMVGLLIRQKYFGILPIGLSKQRVAQFVTDDQFVRPIHEYVNLVAKYVPLYYYRFSYEGDLGVDGKERDVKGVGHGEELSYLWGRESNVSDPSESDLTTRMRLVKLWTNFAKTGNPTPEQDELFQNVIWPTSTFKNITYLDIGKDMKVYSDMENYNIKFWHDLYEINGAPPYDTY